MSLKKIIPNDYIKNELNRRISEIEKSFINELIEIGSKCLIEMQVTQGYQNQTGNLTSSKGFVIAKNGQIQFISHFDSSIGGITGRELATEKAQESKEISLIVVAGMKYAVYVEATGRNVITSSKLLAEDIVPLMLKELGLK